MALAQALGRGGAHVVAVARTVGGLEALDDTIRADGGSATLVPLDLTDFDALDRLGLALHERWGRLDILVANAAVLGPMSPLGHIEPKTFESTLAVNVTANWRLIRSLDPLLRRSDAGRVVFMSSAAAASGAAYTGLYAASKAALEAMARSYASETATVSPVRVTIVRPGPTRTRMRAQYAPGEDPLTLPTPADIAPGILRLLRSDFDRTGMLWNARHNQLSAYEEPS
jgi:NAD(P)-dependent dehydrogenase (short-subunit alcohol dehydrogenase family)